MVVVRMEEDEARENISRVPVGSCAPEVFAGSVISRAVPGPKTRSLNPTGAVYPGSLGSWAGVVNCLCGGGRRFGGSCRLACG